MKIPLSKYHGLGNDFLLTREKDLQELDSKTLNDLIQKACSRHTGLGADGFILVGEEPLEMIYYNQDGSRADMCGNGLRCFARYVKEEGIVDSNHFTVKTLAGDKEVHLHDPNFDHIELELGKPDLSLEKLQLSDELLKTGLRKENGLAWIDIDMDMDLDSDINIQQESNQEKESDKEERDREKAEKDSARLYLLYMNTIHAVLFKDELEKNNDNNTNNYTNTNSEESRRTLFGNPDYRARLGEIYASSNQKLSAGTNVNFVEVLDEHTIEMETYERGCGFTLACGTGAAASAFAACKLKNCKSPLTIRLPLGELVVSIEEGKVILCGPAVRIMKGEYYYE